MPSVGKDLSWEAHFERDVQFDVNMISGAAVAKERLEVLRKLLQSQKEADAAEIVARIYTNLCASSQANLAEMAESGVLESLLGELKSALDLFSMFVFCRTHEEMRGNRSRDVLATD